MPPNFLACTLHIIYGIIWNIDWGCKQCPPGSKPEFLYPNCQSIKPNATYAGDYQNIYEECPPNTYGIVDDCHCKNGNSM